MSEIWKALAQIDYLVEASNLGNIRTVDREVSTIRNGEWATRMVKGRTLRQYDNGKGYKYVTIGTYGLRKNFYIHRLVMIAFIDQPIGKEHVNHIDGNKSNNTLINLEWVTRKENQKHASLNNLIKKGEKCSGAKLTEKNVIIIRRLFSVNPKFNRTEVAKKLNVSCVTIHRVINNTRWKHV